MSSRSQSGFTIVESVVATAVIAVAGGGLVFAMSAFGRFATHQAGPVHTAAAILAEETLRIAQDAWKYGSPGTAPEGTMRTAVPVIAPGAAATTAPVTVTTALSSVTATDAALTVQVQYTPDPGHSSDPGSVSISGAVVVKAPAPGSQVIAPAAIPAPSGAP